MVGQDFFCPGLIKADAKGQPVGARVAQARRAEPLRGRRVQVVAGIASCEQLEADVRSGILAEPREFNYHPHVTVAHELDDDALDHAFDSLADFEASFEVPAFWLFDHGEDGLWRPVREFRLGGG